tara:strand:+ start:6785 stop:7123 length:339 start_codon:yes stop_codon:yes gene_type:complete
MIRSPSIKALKPIFGDNAKQAKALLIMTRAQLMQTPIGAALVAECYHAPSTQDIRMECLNDLGDFDGVEGFETIKGECLYLNAGDTYTPTLVRFNCAYRVACWGDVAERYGA